MTASTLRRPSASACSTVSSTPVASSTRPPRYCESIAGTTASAANNKEMALRSPAMDPISALAYETLAYREVIWHDEVVERINSAYSGVKPA